MEPALATVLLRFALRLLLLLAFAAMSSQGFFRAFGALSLLFSMACVIAGAMRHEAIFGPSLNYWDEAVAFGAVACLAITCAPMNAL
jgi:hypothetical protein